MFDGVIWACEVSLIHEPYMGCFWYGRSFIAPTKVKGENAHCYVEVGILFPNKIYTYFKIKAVELVYWG